MQERRVNLVLLVVGLMLSAAALEAQPQFNKLPRSLDEALNAKIPIQFSLAPPGARSLGMGGAFIAIADDATASEANPAGLTILNKPEFSFHLRDYSFDGTLDDPKTAIAFRVANDVRRDESDPNRIVPRPQSLCDTGDCTLFEAKDSQRRVRDTSTDLSFVSYVKPLSKWVFSAYYNRFANFAASSVLQGPGGTGNFFEDPLLFDRYEGTTTSGILAESLGLSGAFQITKQLSFGVSLRVTELEVDNTDLFRIDDFGDLELETFQFGNLPSIRLDRSEFTDILLARRRVTGSDSDLTYNVGLLWNANQKVSAGLVIKKGGEFSFARRTFRFDCISFEGVLGARRAALGNYVDLPATSQACNPDTGAGDFVSVAGEQEDRETIVIPDLLGVGIAWRPNERFTVAADLNLITYSDLSPGLVQPTDPRTGQPVGVPQQIRGADGPFAETVDDEIELHVGGEYVFLAGAANNPVTIRAGFFNEPDHDGFANVDSSDDHLTVGGGVVLKNKFQVDVAASLSDRQDVVVFSLVYRR